MMLYTFLGMMKLHHFRAKCLKLDWRRSINGPYAKSWALSVHSRLTAPAAHSVRRGSGESWVNTQRSRFSIWSNVLFTWFCIFSLLPRVSRVSDLEWISEDVRDFWIKFPLDPSLVRDFWIKLPLDPVRIESHDQLIWVNCPRTKWRNAVFKTDPTCSREALVMKADIASRNYLLSLSRNYLLLSFTLLSIPEAISFLEKGDIASRNYLLRC